MTDVLGALGGRKRPAPRPPKNLGEKPPAARPSGFIALARGGELRAEFVENPRDFAGRVGRQARGVLAKRPFALALFEQRHDEIHVSRMIFIHPQGKGFRRSGGG